LLKLPSVTPAGEKHGPRALSFNAVGEPAAPRTSSSGEINKKGFLLLLQHGRNKNCLHVSTNDKTNKNNTINVKHTNNTNNVNNLALFNVVVPAPTTVRNGVVAAQSACRYTSMPRVKGRGTGKGAPEAARGTNLPKPQCH